MESKKTDSNVIAPFTSLLQYTSIEGFLIFSQMRMNGKELWKTTIQAIEYIAQNLLLCHLTL